MSAPAISVCILNYNYGRYLRQAIDSALGQKPGGYALAEIVVIDDGSTDDSPGICASYRDRIRVAPPTPTADSPERSRRPSARPAATGWRSSTPMTGSPRTSSR